MKNTVRLNSEDRGFFRLVNQAAFSNPFGPEREELDRRIAGVSGKLAQDELVNRAVKRVLERVAGLEREGQADLRLFSPEEGQLVQSALLFDVYYRFIDAFDRLILQQIEAGDVPCPVPFAGEVLSLLRRRGFSAEEGRRFFAFFYQMRRAFFFIHHSLAGQSPSMGRLRCHLWNNVFTSDIRWYERFLWSRMEDFSTMILGETGSGKGAAAAAIGRSGFIPYDEKKGCFSESFTRNFIGLNLSQFPEALIESELFGHKKGAFTGAVEDHSGVFARCTPHGAIFLDEIGEVSVPVQVKLLQVLQERTFSPVGSREKRRFSGRVIAATNRSLDALRQQGTFRDDFFYRLCSDIVTVPPLRQRLKEDPAELDILLEHVVRRTLGESAPDLAASIREILERDLGRDYSWPGNVRELEQAVRRILLTREYRGEAASAPSDPAASLHRGIDNESLDAQGLLAAYCIVLHQCHGTYEAVARRTGLDRRTVKKYIQEGEARNPRGDA
jgi:DNA-binding NtrC family response regulator